MAARSVSGAERSPSSRPASRLARTTWPSRTWRNPKGASSRWSSMRRPLDGVLAERRRRPDVRWTPWPRACAAGRAACPAAAPSGCSRRRRPRVPSTSSPRRRSPRASPRWPGGRRRAPGAGPPARPSPASRCRGAPGRARGCALRRWPRGRSRRAPRPRTRRCAPAPCVSRSRRSGVSSTTSDPQRVGGSGCGSAHRVVPRRRRASGWPSTSAGRGAQRAVGEVSAVVADQLGDHLAGRGDARCRARPCRACARRGRGPSGPPPSPGARRR